MKYLITYQLLSSQTTTAPSISKIVDFVGGLTEQNITEFMQSVKMRSTQSVAIIYIKELAG